MNYSKLSSQEKLAINTLGELKKSGYQPKSIRQELRDNLIQKIKNKENVF